jgi:hypothetical protein
VSAQVVTQQLLFSGVYRTCGLGARVRVTGLFKIRARMRVWNGEASWQTLYTITYTYTYAWCFFQSLTHSIKHHARVWQWFGSQWFRHWFYRRSRSRSTVTQLYYSLLAIHVTQPLCSIGDGRSITRPTAVFYIGSMSLSSIVFVL